MFRDPSKYAPFAHFDSSLLLISVAASAQSSHALDSVHVMVKAKGVTPQHCFILCHTPALFHFWFNTHSHPPLRRLAFPLFISIFNGAKFFFRILLLQAMVQLPLKRPIITNCLLGIHAMALPALHSSLSHAWAHSIACCRFVIMSIVAPLTFTGIQP